MMQKPEFGGLFFDDAVNSGAVMYWGARAVISRPGRLELYRDRQGYTADDETDKDEFFEWLNGKLIPYLENCAKGYKTEHVVVSNRDGRFHAVAEDRNSGGYLYVGAWAIKEG